MNDRNIDSADDEAVLFFCQHPFISFEIMVLTGAFFCDIFIASSKEVYSIPNKSRKLCFALFNKQ